ncbi:MAG: glycosyltransferase [Candidatus Hodarchaeota archaeon]
MLTLPVTVIIPVKNRKDLILMTLHSIMKQSHCPSEVIVVDDRSTDGTWKTLVHFKETITLPFALFLYRTKNGSKGPGIARNYGLSHASSELVAFTDSDCIADKSWLFKLTHPLLNPEKPTELVGTSGKVRTYRKDFIGEFCDAMELLNPPPNLYFLVTANCCYKRTILEDSGGFKKELRRHEDSELSSRLLNQGYRFEFVPDAIIYHYFSPKIGDLIRTFSKWGQGAYDRYKVEGTIISRTEEDIKKVNRRFSRPESFPELMKVLFRQIDLLTLVSWIIRDIQALIISSIRKKHSLGKIIAFIGMLFLIRFVYWSGFVRRQRFEARKTS